MKVKVFLGCMIVAVLMTAAALAERDDWKVVQDDEWCNDFNGYCEVREITLTDRNDLQLESVNGAIRVEGWNQDVVHVKARVQVRKSNRDEARRIADEVEIEVGDVIKARRGSSFKKWRNRKWSVSYKVMVPRDMDVEVGTTNGSVKVIDVNAAVTAGTTNGSVRIEGAAGDVFASTTNGAIDCELHEQWKGNDIEMSTTNGAVKLVAPEDFSADVKARTVNGGVRVDHAIRINNKTKRRLDGRIGDGDAKVRISTVNGGVKIIEG